MACSELNFSDLQRQPELIRSSSQLLLRSKSQNNNKTSSKPSNSESDVASATESSTDIELPVARRIMNYLCMRWHQGKFCDVKFKCQDGEILAHSVILSVYSRRLAKDIGSWRKEEMPMLDAQIFPSKLISKVLEFLYTTEIEIKDDLIDSLTYCSTYFDIRELFIICCQYLSDYDVRTAVLYYVVAMRYEITTLVNRIWKFMCVNFEEVSKTDYFLACDLDIIRQLLSENCLAVSSESRVLEAAVRWLEVDSQRRQGQAVNVMDCVRLTQMSPEEIIDLEANSYFTSIPDFLRRLYHAMCYHCLRTQGTPVAAGYAIPVRTGPASLPLGVDDQDRGPESFEYKPVKKSLLWTKNDNTDDTRRRSSTPSPKRVQRRFTIDLTDREETRTPVPFSSATSNVKPSNRTNIQKTIPERTSAEMKPGYSIRTPHLTGNLLCVVDGKSKKYSLKKLSQNSGKSGNNDLVFAKESNDQLSKGTEEILPLKPTTDRLSLVHRDGEVQLVDPIELTTVHTSGTGVNVVDLLDSGVSIAELENLRDDEFEDKSATHSDESSIDGEALNEGPVDSNEVSAPVLTEPAQTMNLYLVEQMSEGLLTIKRKDMKSNRIVKFDTKARKSIFMTQVPELLDDAILLFLDYALYVIGSEICVDDEGFVVQSTKAFFKYVLETGAWQNVSPLLTDRTGHRAVVHNGKIYVIGGTDQTMSYVTTIDEYDPKTNIWRVIGHLPNGRIRPCVSVVKNRLYVVGGMDSEGQQAEALIYKCFSTGKWHNCRSFKNSHSLVSLVTICNTLFLVRRSLLQNEEGIGDHILQYNADNDVWAPVTYLSSHRIGAAHVAADSTIIIIGGTTASGLVFNKVECFDVVKRCLLEKHPYTATMPVCPTPDGVCAVPCSVPCHYKFT